MIKKLNIFTKVSSHRLLLVPAAFALLSGCSSDISDLEQWVAEKKAERVPFRDDIPSPKPYEPHDYSASDLRSPFQPNVEQRAEVDPGSGISPDLHRNKQPLENYSLDSLRMVGSLLKQNITFALVQAPDGLIHRVQSGNFVGENDGEITAITESSIDLTEIVPDGLGNYVQRDASIGLSD